VNSQPSNPASEDDSRRSFIESALLLCEERISYTFSDRKLLKRCLTHSSSANTRLDSNERLEFLGDAILGTVICEYLYDQYPDHREGQLTQQKSHLVSRATCARIATELQISELVFVGKGLSKVPNSIRAAVIEALIAGIYLDSGMDAARKFILSAFEKQLNECVTGEIENYKSLLQEEIQKTSNTPPNYVVVDEMGPDHARQFVVVAEVDGQQFEPATGRSKKEAEQKAALNALNILVSQPPDAE
jgi:ribonuclease-3